MLKWLPYPAVRAFLAFSLGICLGLETEIDQVALEVGSLMFFILYVSILSISNTNYGFQSLILALLAFSLLLMFGSLRAKVCTHLPDPKIESADYFLAMVSTPTYAKGRYQLTGLMVEMVWSEGHSYDANDQMIWYQLSEVPHLLSYGTRVLLRGSPTRIAKPKNPLEFDYAQFMAGRNVFWNFRTRENQLQAIFLSNGSAVHDCVSKIRSHLKSLVADNIPQGVPQEITLAMLLGDRKAVSNQLKEAFANSGTIHILAVSGLHMGILYWMILQVVGSWRYHFLLKWLFALLSLIILWGFTMLSGAAAATQRAATMYSIMIIAQVVNKQSNAINTLGIAGLIILWVDPYQLHAVGFQLSFLALAGILYIQPRLASWFKLKHNIAKYFWQLISVSLSAQLAVLPLCAHYFNQLPVYFLIANIFLVPLSFAILVSGVLFFACTNFPLLLPLAAAALSQLTRLAGYIVESIAGFPQNSIDNIQLDFIAIILWYGILVSGILFLKTRKRLPLLALMSFILFLIVKSGLGHIMELQQKQITIYQLSGHTAIDFVSGKHLYSLMDGNLAAKPKTLDYKIGNYRRYLNPELIEPVTTSNTNDQPLGLWMFHGKRLLLIKDSIGDNLSANACIKADIVIVTMNSVDHLKQFMSYVDFELLVIDGSNSRKKANRLEKQALELDLEVHNSWNMGYKRINL